jgi:hypothetical protein
MNKITIDDIRDHIVSTEKVAHVTFYLVKDKNDPFEESYFVYSESEKRGLEQLTHFASPYQEALIDLQAEITLLEVTLEEKRKGIPTPKQVYFLFKNQIPIPIDLTWGQASDLIDEKLNQLEYEKQAYLQKKAEKFDGFAIKNKISYAFPGNNNVEIGTIAKLYERQGVRYARINLDNGGYLQAEWTRLLPNMTKIQTS